MLNKVFMFFLALFFCLACHADVWLGKEKREILDNLSGKGGIAEIIINNGDELKMKCVIEDERCRNFEVEYRFRLEKGVCVSYSEKVPIHSYWVGVYKDFINQQEGRGAGEELDVDGESLQTNYTFIDYSLNFKIEHEHLIATFMLVKT